MRNAQAQVLHSSSRVWAAALEGHQETEAVGTRICTTKGKSSKREVSWESWDTSAWLGRCDTGLQACYRECCDLEEGFRAEEAALPWCWELPPPHPAIRGTQSPGTHLKLRWVPTTAAEFALLLCSEFQPLCYFEAWLGEDTLESLDWLCTSLGYPKSSSGKLSFSFPATEESLNQGCVCR